MSKSGKGKLSDCVLRPHEKARLIRPGFLGIALT